MGGSYYDGDVAARARQSNTDWQEHARRMREATPRERQCHTSMNPKNKVRECRDNEEHPVTTPIAVVMDLTKSRGQDTKIIFAKMPMFIGQIIRNGYATDPELCISGVGDTTCDRAPLQVGQFESDNRIDKDLSNLWPEEGGGGTGRESYQLAAYFFAYKTELDCLARGKKGFLFFLGDEGFYEKVSKDELKNVLGEDISRDVPSSEVFADLQKKYHVFFIFPRKGWEDRKGDIDEEIKQRVQRAGGLVEGVDIRFSLIWNNRNDLDLHVQTPSGHHIYYGNKRSPCGGELDVDMNVRGETTKPVENTRWEKGQAKSGRYHVWVENYCFHESSSSATPFAVEIEINGEVSRFEGKTPARAVHGHSRVDVTTFDYEPASRKEDVQDGRYDLYKDDVVISQWADVIPREQVLLIQDPKAAVDVILGAIVLTNGVRDLDGYIKDVEGRPLEENGVKYQPQTPERLEDIKTALADYAALKAAAIVDMSSLPRRSSRSARKSNSRRL